MSRGDSSSRGVTPGAEFADDEVAPTHQRDAFIGQQLGEFLIEARLGEGAMGIVYRGVQPLIGRPVAVKVLKPGFQAEAESLLAEARAVTSARHPNIIDILSFGQTPGGQQYFVMELLQGEPLDLWLRSHPPTTLEVVQLLKQVLAGLSAAHAANVVHRDLKPGNLFVAPMPDGSAFVKILDFGLAKRVTPQGAEATIGKIAGTPLYMAPEQTRGQSVTPRTDLYAVGCIAFELLTGAPPFTASSVAEVLLKQQSATPPALPPELPPALSELVFALLAKDPTQRPSSALSARQQLERVERRLLVAAGTNPTLPQLTDERVAELERLKKLPPPAPRPPRSLSASQSGPRPMLEDDPSSSRPTTLEVRSSGPKPRPTELEAVRPTRADPPSLNDDEDGPPTSKGGKTERFEPLPSSRRWPFVVVGLGLLGAGAWWANSSNARVTEPVVPRVDAPQRVVPFSGRFAELEKRIEVLPDIERAQAAAALRELESTVRDVSADRAEALFLDFENRWLEPR